MKRKAISCLLVLASVLTMTPSIPTLAAENQAGKTVVNETLAGHQLTVYRRQMLPDLKQRSSNMTRRLRLLLQYQIV